jgi:glycosyltransferase involved in cell wall biosynthesis
MTEPAHWAGLSLVVVIPTLDEERPLAAALESLGAQVPPPDRLVVADGGSRDGTVRVAERYGAEILVVPGRGRGGQVAAAVARLGEDVVLVAHADMRFPAGALAAVRQALVDDPTSPGGCLGHRFDRPRLRYRLVEWWDRRRGLRGDSYGDQAQFFRRNLLARVGGFPDQAIMEDVELARRLRCLGHPLYLDLPVTVSARRFERLGWWRVVWTNWAYRRAYRRGGMSACQAIYDRYYRPGNRGGVRGPQRAGTFFSDP